ncbi:MAG: hypothetical protein EXS49_01175 [Candidatus Pacebacteria bacterium]|nr:hypothetical protein [Candidatus Paceibacterota bacterium]
MIIKKIIFTTIGFVISILLIDIFNILFLNNNTTFKNQYDFPVSHLEGLIYIAVYFFWAEIVYLTSLLILKSFNKIDKPINLILPAITFSLIIFVIEYNVFLGIYMWLVMFLLGVFINVIFFRKDILKKMFHES